MTMIILSITTTIMMMTRIMLMLMTLAIGTGDSPKRWTDRCPRASLFEFSYTDFSISLYWYFSSNDFSYFSWFEYSSSDLSFPLKSDWLSSFKCIFGDYVWYHNLSVIDYVGFQQTGQTGQVTWRIPIQKKDNPSPLHLSFVLLTVKSNVSDLYLGKRYSSLPSSSSFSCPSSLLAPHHGRQTWKF